MPLMPSEDEITEVELIYRNKKKASEQPAIKSPADAHTLLLKGWNMDKIELQEQFKIMLLDSKNSCIGISTVASGGVSECPVDLKLAFSTALKARASGIILAHNHPSGNIDFSESDKALTQKFAQAGKLLDIKVIDHLVITKEGYTSFCNKGIMPPSCP